MRVGRSAGPGHLLGRGGRKDPEARAHPPAPPWREGPRTETHRGMRARRGVSRPTRLSPLSDDSPPLHGFIVRGAIVGRTSSCPFLLGFIGSYEGCRLDQRLALCLLWQYNCLLFRTRTYNNVYCIRHTSTRLHMTCLIMMYTSYVHKTTRAMPRSPRKRSG